MLQYYLTASKYMLWK